MRRGFATFALIAAILTPYPRAAADAPPIEAYGRLPLIQDARLSPDGTAIAMIAPVGGRQALVVRHLDGGEPPSGMGGTDWIPDWFAWKSDHRLIVSVRKTVSSLAMGHLMAITRLVAVDADGKNIKNIIHPRPDQSWMPQIQDRLVDILPNDPDHILIAVDRHQQNVPDVVQVDVNSGMARDVVVGKLGIVDWMTDQTGAVRVGVAIRGAQTILYIRDSPTSDWRVVSRSDGNFGSPLQPLSFSSDPNVLYAETAPRDGAWGIYEFDVAKGAFIRQVVGSPDHDVVPVERDERLIGYARPDDHGGGPRVVYLDPDWASDSLAIDRALPATRNLLIDRTADGAHALILASGPANPGAYYIFNRQGSKATLEPFGSPYPEIPSDQIQPVTQIIYPARDGLPIHAFVTWPRGVARGPIPFVILPHGGPTARDSDAFDWMAQFLASRGYGVLQPNFRGSTGYGPAFEQAGLQQWGLAMQDDVTDGTKWLIDKKLADPGRICIAGASYGGYAALMGVVKEPDLYRCAVSLSGISDLERLIADMRYLLFADLNRPRISNGKLEETSPGDHADQIKVPVLLLHGRQDFTVPVGQTEEMERALKRAGKPVEAIYFDDEDHYLSLQKDRIAFLTALERFLRANIGPGAARP